MQVISDVTATVLTEQSFLPPAAVAREKTS